MQKKIEKKNFYAKVTRRSGTNSTGPAVEKVKKKVVTTLQGYSTGATLFQGTWILHTIDHFLSETSVDHGRAVYSKDKNHLIPSLWTLDVQRTVHVFIRILWCDVVSEVLTSSVHINWNLVIQQVCDMKDGDILVVRTYHIEPGDSGGIWHEDGETCTRHHVIDDRNMFLHVNTWVMGKVSVTFLTSSVDTIWGCLSCWLC